MKTPNGRKVTLELRMSRFQLPPVRSALIVGRRATIGAKALEKALQEMMPDAYERVDLQHPAAEAALIRSVHLRTVPRDVLVSTLLKQVDNLMDETDTIHIDMDVIVCATEELEV